MLCRQREEQDRQTQQGDYVYPKGQPKRRKEKTQQPQPKCGFVLKGTEGTLSSYDYEPTIRMQTRKKPAGEDLRADVLKPPHANPIQYFVDCLRRDRAPEGPLSPVIARIGQQIVDSAVLSAKLKRTVKLVD